MRTTIAALLIAVGVGLMALGIVGSLSGGADCPKGQQYAVLYYQPVTTYINSTPIITMQPVYGCES